MPLVVELMLIPQPHVTRKNHRFVENRIVIGVIPRIIEIFCPKSGIHRVVVRQLRVKAAVKIDHIGGVGRPGSIEEQPCLVFAKSSDKM